ncbi:RDD family protein [Rasiella rasia]|uniref:RDD family protein n=1 Tax=Rasiella rasia TaxID=2744027 RepID=A0A6G6GKX4_9FLAO|nr:RDD family protein [Rasiella rasia]QIE58341.1 RDD family protein [Rasiella rasia]
MKNTQQKRIFAFIIDATIVGITSRMFENLFSSLIASKAYNVFDFEVTVSISSALLFYAVYFFSFDLTKKGVTVGKHLTKIEVTSEQSIKLTKLCLLKRTCIKLIGVIFLPISALVFLLTDGKTLHDYIVKTFTIEKKNS